MHRLDALPVKEIGIYADAAAPKAVRGRGQGDGLFSDFAGGIPGGAVGRGELALFVKRGNVFVAGEVNTDWLRGDEAFGASHGWYIRGLVRRWVHDEHAETD